MINISGRNKTAFDLQESFGATLSSFWQNTEALKWKPEIFFHTYCSVVMKSDISASFFSHVHAWGWALDHAWLGTRWLDAWYFSLLLKLISKYLTSFFFPNRSSSSWRDITTLIPAKCSRAPSGGRTHAAGFSANAYEAHEQWKMDFQ